MLIGGMIGVVALMLGLAAGGTWFFILREGAPFAETAVSQPRPRDKTPH